MDASLIDRASTATKSLDADLQNQSAKLMNEASTKKMMNLSTSDAEIMDMMNKAFNEGSDADRQKFTMLMQERQARISMLSNLIRMMGDIKNAIIRNIRA